MKHLFPFFNPLSSLLLAAFFFFSCSERQHFEDTPTSGVVNISIDESYTLLFQNQIYTFQNLYERAKVNVRYRTEKQALEDLMSDSSKVAVLNRELTKDEITTFEKKNVFPKTIKIAEDAVALIINPLCTDTTITVDKLKGLLAGVDSSGPISGKKLSLVFDNNESTNARFMRKLIDNKPLSPNCFSLSNNDEVIDYVAKNQYSIGIISVNWISDRDDTLSQRFLSKVRVVALANNENSSYFKPYQAYILTKQYPLTRSVYMINRQTRAGLGTGFVSFVAGEKGQRMIKLQGMVPASMPVRLVEIK